MVDVENVYKYFKQCTNVYKCLYISVYQAWAKCIHIRIYMYSNTFLKVFVFVFEYFCQKYKVFEYIPKVFVFMNTFTNIFEIFHFV